MANISQNISVRKASGELEAFNIEKLKQSLRRAGGNEEIIAEVTADIKNWIKDGVSTKHLYARAFKLLNRDNRLNALRYKLKQALYEFGPSGYPFEHFIGEIYRRRGYSVEVGKEIDGSCISHEMDVIATTKTNQIFLECKYSSHQGKYVSIHVPLYVKARIDDIIIRRENMPEYAGLKFSGGVVSNTRFSPDSIAYSKCYNLSLLGWDYPNGNGLKDIIEREKIIPITVLHELTKNQISRLLDLGFVTCKQIRDNLSVLDEFNLSKNKTRKLREDLEHVEFF
jgi:hypothetical protein